MLLDIYQVTFIALSVWILLSRFEREVFEKRGIEKGALTLTWRTERGLNTLERIGERGRRAIVILSSLAVVISVPIMLLSLYSLLFWTLDVVSDPSAPSAVAPVIPGVQIEGSPIYIPLWYGIIALIVVLIAHELSHGLVAAAEGVKINSVGVIFLTLLPIMAFVEPDEEVLEKSNKKTKLRVFAAGSFGNFLVALIAILLLVTLITPAFFQHEMQVRYVVPGGPAALSGLQENSTLLSINGMPVASKGDFGKIIKGIKPGDEVAIETESGVAQVKTSHRPLPNTTIGGLIYKLKGLDERGYMGIVVIPVKTGLSPGIVSILGSRLPLNIYWQLVWIYLLNLLIGITNLLPLYPLDGGRVFEELADGIAPRVSRQVAQTVFLLTFSLLLINLGRFFNLL